MKCCGSRKRWARPLVSPAARSWLEMKVVYHASAGPELEARLAAMKDLDISICPETDDMRLTMLLRDCEVLWARV